MGTARQARQELTGFAEPDSLQSPKWGTGPGAMIGCGNLDRRTTALQGRRGMPTGRPGPLIPWAGMSDAAVRAHAILEGEDAAILAGIRMAFADRVAWRIPHGRTLRLSWSSAASDLSLDPAQEGPAL